MQFGIFSDDYRMTDYRQSLSLVRPDNEFYVVHYGRNNNPVKLFTNYTLALGFAKSFADGQGRVERVDELAAMLLKEHI